MIGEPLTVFSVVAVVSAAGAATIASDLHERQPAFYVLKPAVTTLILVIALMADAGPAGFHWLVVAGLVASLAGDVALMLPNNRLALGLGCFLVAHVLYIAAFARLSPVASPLVAAALAAYAGLLVKLLWPYAKKLRWAVAAYAAVLAAMVWTATGVWLAEGGLRGALVLAGAALFLVSDSVLARQRFVIPHMWGQAVILSTYYAAQLLIALSLHA